MSDIRQPHTSTTAGVRQPTSEFGPPEALPCIDRSVSPVHTGAILTAVAVRKVKTVAVKRGAGNALSLLRPHCSWPKRILFKACISQAHNSLTLGG